MPEGRDYYAHEAMKHASDGLAASLRSTPSTCTSSQVGSRAKGTRHTRQAMINKEPGAPQGGSYSPQCPHAIPLSR
jgi:hypothetical protein